MRCYRVRPGFSVFGGIGVIATVTAEGLERIWPSWEVEIVFEHCVEAGARMFNASKRPLATSLGLSGAMTQPPHSTRERRSLSFDSAI
jgi:hypothetical protein